MNNVLRSRAVAGILACVALGCGGEKPKAEAPGAPASVPSPTVQPPAAEAPAQAGAPTAAPATAPAAAPVATAGVNGATEYTVCAACHQLTGLGIPAAFPPLAGSEVVQGPPERVIAIVLHGLQGPITVKGATYNGVMAAWSQLTDAQIAAIITYERSSWGNTAPAVTPDQVAAVRKATASRATAWTLAELDKARLK